jgi:histidine ammonia-lyase
MSAYGTYICNKGPKAMLFSDLIACVSLEAFDGRIEPFSELIHLIDRIKDKLPQAHTGIPGGK